MIILTISFLGVFGILASIGLLIFYRDAVLERLSVLVDQSGVQTGFLARLVAGRRVESVEQIIKPFQNLVPRSQQELSVVQKRLVRAGYRKDLHVNVFYASKVLVPLSLCL